MRFKWRNIILLGLMLILSIILANAITYCPPNGVCECDPGDGCMVQDYVFNSTQLDIPIINKNCTAYYSNLTDDTITLLQKNQLQNYSTGWHNHTINVSTDSTLSYRVECNTSLVTVGKIWSGIIRVRDTERTLLTTITGNQVTLDANIGDPSTNSTNIWDYIYGDLSGSTSDRGGLLYRVWRYGWRTTSGVET